MAVWLLAGCSLRAVAIGQDSEVQQYSDAGSESPGEWRLRRSRGAYEKLRDLEPGIAEVHANLGLIYFQERKIRPGDPGIRNAP